MALLHYELDVGSVCLYALFRDFCDWQKALAGSHSVPPLSRGDECQEPRPSPNVQDANTVLPCARVDSN